MDDNAWRAAGRSTDTMTSDPVSVAGFRYGMMLCEDEYKVAYALSSRLPLGRRLGSSEFRKAIVSLATACWKYRINHWRLIQGISTRLALGVIFGPGEVLERVAYVAEGLSKVPWSRSEAVVEIEAELVGVTDAMEACTQEGMTTEEIFTKAVKTRSVRADIAYVLAIMNCYGEIASAVLPGAVWSFRVNPLRQKILSEMMCDVGVSNAD